MVESSPRAQQRRQRLARELRENLKRRKAQARGRAQKPAGTGPRPQLQDG
jgi:hypothetical protein